jgi:hypothetical protein
MLATLDRVAAQVTKTTNLITADQALEIARERYSNLCSEGILSRKAIGTPVDLNDLEIALAFFRKCRPTKVPNMHSFDLRLLIGGRISVGALIAAAVALGFDVRSWYGVMEFGVHAMIAVRQIDVRRVAESQPQGSRPMSCAERN